MERPAYCVGAIVAAKAREKERLDKLQRGFLYDLGMCDSEVFVVYNLAPHFFEACH